jgi:hypothetical protein
MKEKEIIEDKPNSFWYRVYFAVFAFMVLMITILALFSWYFSR